MKKLVLGLLACFLMQSPALSDEIVKQMTDSNDIDTVYEVERWDGSLGPAIGTHTDYVYQLMDGTIIHSPDKIKCKDARPFRKKHPKLLAFQEFCTFANPIIIFIGLMLN